MKQIRYITPGVEKMPGFVKEELIRKFEHESQIKDDWFYEVRVGQIRFFVCDNGEDGYTAMLPSEY